ncbi:MAG TPA: DUF4345 domain-containing protein [Pyrinomonadaceae bacterium]|nr:DUF4345 domain-containing protein [Pyrinomonadaceae bacterium]
MSLGKTSLVIAAASFFVYGLAFLCAPAWASSFVGIELPVPSARIDARATYGGFFLGAGVFWAMCARRAAWLRAGLAAQAVILAGFVFGRVVGMVFDGGANTAIYVLLAGEIAGVALALAALKQHGAEAGRG